MPGKLSTEAQRSSCQRPIYSRPAPSLRVQFVPAEIGMTRWPQEGQENWVPESAPGSPAPSLGDHFCRVPTALEQTGAAPHTALACPLRIGRDKTGQGNSRPKVKLISDGMETPTRLPGVCEDGGPATPPPPPSSVPEALVCIRPSQAWHRAKTPRALPYFGKWVRIRVRFSSGSLSFSCLACSSSCRRITVKTERSSVLPNTWAVSYRGRLSQNWGTLQ